ncbi:hypothetical protein RclHR1_06170006 [Rhizophagus clarus]|uniref:Uncharacterized protein n=1 Tax=Rhizophagus clarus TaxID=94130 RepID=A0A2Z6S8Y3_9GLOM|nr:hypothetical protein RclHR1_06170006 [Rhizophagus clarus]
MASQRGFKTDSQHTRCVAIHFKVCKQSRTTIGSLFRQRDISAQETCHILLDLPLYHSSQQFVFLNLNKEAPKWICGTGENEESFEVNDLGQTEKSLLKAYWDQPTELKNFTLFQLHLTHKLVKENDTMAWSILYNCHLEEINTDLINILGSPKDDVESEILDEEEENLIEDEEQDEY